MNQKIKNIIFDWDGVLVDSIDKMCEVNADTTSFKTKNEDYGNIFLGNSISYGEKNTDKKELNSFWKNWSIESQKIFPDKNIYKKLQDFKKKNNLKFFIISSNLEENILMSLKNADLEDIFEEVLGKDTHSLKTEKFKILENKFNTNSKNSIFITDSLGDIKEANEVSYKSIGVTFGVHKKEILEEGNPEKVFDSWDEIFNYLEKIV